MELLNNKLIKNPTLIILGAAFIFLSTLLAFKLPGSSIPQTGQTFGVLVVAAVLGQTLGFFSVIIYLMLGLVGLPVFAEGNIGADVLWGPTRGYLFGFIFSALLCGWWCSQHHNRSILSIFSIMLMAHLLILGMGWLWLSSILGPAEAFQQGVTPFFYGAFFKSLLAALLVFSYFRLTHKISRNAVVNKV